MRCSLKTCQHLIVLLCAALPAQGANSQENPQNIQQISDQVRPSIVFLMAEALKRGTGEKLSAGKNGVIVSSRGLVLTTYDLIGSFDHQPGSLKVKADDPKDSEKTIRLAIIDYSEHLNLLLLSLPSEGYSYLRMAPSAADQRVLFSGYRAEPAETPGPPKLEYKYGTGVKSDPSDTEAEVSLQTVNTDVEIWVRTLEGKLSFALDGGAVYNAQGQLVGILNGGTDTRHITYTKLFYAHRLLSPVRVDTVMEAVEALKKGIQDNIADALNQRIPKDIAELETAVEDLSTSTVIDLDALLSADEEGFVHITYDKMLRLPAIKEMRLRVIGLRPNLTFTPWFPDDSSGWSITRRVPDDTDPTKGRFDVSAEFVSIISSLERTYPDLTHYRFNVVATLDDLEKHTITFETTKSRAEVGGLPGS